VLENQFAEKLNAPQHAREQLDVNKQKHPQNVNHIVVKIKIHAESSAFN
jgi:hypothetical protein